MRHLKPVTAKSFVWFAGILSAAAFMIMSPAGSLFLSATASLIVVFPTVFSKGKVRLIAAVLLLVSLSLSLSKYPAFKREQTLYRQRHEMKRE